MTKTEFKPPDWDKILWSARVLRSTGGELTDSLRGLIQNLNRLLEP